MPRSDEATLYEPVKNWFLSVRQCADAIADTPSENRSVRLPRDERLREIDVAAIEPEHRRRSAVHLAEGKRLCRGHSFTECLAQAEAVAPYGDFIWVFFPADEWARLSELNRKANESDVQKRKLGLLLVGKKGVEMRIDAPRNREANEDQVTLVLDAFQTDRTLPRISTLGTEGSRTAARTLAVCETVKQAVRDALGWNSDWEADSSEDHAYYIEELREDSNPAYVTLDPFGVAALDGLPSLWIWSHPTKAALRKAAKSGALPGSHVWFDNGDWQWELVPKGDISVALIDRLERAGFGTVEDHLAVGQRIEISGREIAAIKREVSKAVAALNKPIK